MGSDAAKAPLIRRRRAPLRGLLALVLGGTHRGGGPLLFRPTEAFVAVPNPSRSVAMRREALNDLIDPNLSTPSPTGQEVFDAANSAASELSAVAAAAFAAFVATTRSELATVSETTRQQLAAETTKTTAAVAEELTTARQAVEAFESRALDELTAKVAQAQTSSSANAQSLLSDISSLSRSLAEDDTFAKVAQSAIDQAERVSTVLNANYDVLEKTTSDVTRRTASTYADAASQLKRALTENYDVLDKTTDEVSRQTALKYADVAIELSKASTTLEAVAKDVNSAIMDAKAYSDKVYDAVILDQLTKSVTKVKSAIAIIDEASKSAIAIIDEASKSNEAQQVVARSKEALASVKTALAVASEATSRVQGLAAQEAAREAQTVAALLRASEAQTSEALGRIASSVDLDSQLSAYSAVLSGLSASLRAAQSLLAQDANGYVAFAVTAFAVAAAAQRAATRAAPLTEVSTLDRRGYAYLASKSGQFLSTEADLKKAYTQYCVEHAKCYKDDATWRAHFERWKVRFSLVQEYNNNQEAAVGKRPKLVLNDRADLPGPDLLF